MKNIQEPYKCKKCKQEMVYRFIDTTKMNIVERCLNPSCDYQKKLEVFD